MVGISVHPKLHNKVGVASLLPSWQVPGFPGMYGWRVFQSEIQDSERSAQIQAPLGWLLLWASDCAHL